MTTWFVEKKIKFNKVIRGAKSRAQALGIKVHPKTIMSNDVIGQVGAVLIQLRIQITKVANERDSDLVIASTEKPENPGKVIKELLIQATCDVAVLVLPSEKKTPRITKVMCSLLRTKNDRYVVKYATMMAQSQELNILLLHINKPGTIANQDEVNEYTTIATKYSSMKVRFSLLEN